MKNLSPKFRAVVGGLIGLVVLALIAMSQTTPQGLAGYAARNCVTQKMDNNQMRVICKKMIQETNPRLMGKTQGIRNPR